MDPTTHLLIIAAMDEEERALRAALAGKPAEDLSLSVRMKISAQQFRCGDRRVSLLRSGMGSVNAAVGLAMFCERYTPDAILLLGVGGALTDSLRIGDLVVSNRVLQHDYFSSLDFGHPRMKPGEVVLSEEEAARHTPWFPADSQWAEWICAREPSAVRGTVLSGSEFVGTLARKREIAKLDPEAVLVDMEAAGVAQIATRAGIPFVVAKTVSDRLLPDGTIESDFRACLHAAAANVAGLLKALLDSV